MSRDISALQDLDEIVHAAVGHIGSTLRSTVAILLPDENRRLYAAASAGGWSLPERDWSIAQWAFDHRERAGRGTSTLPGAEALHVPLAASRGTVGLLAIRLGAEEAPWRSSAPCWPTRPRRTASGRRGRSSGARS
jgi:two-component system sensor histidine kinase KdpD